MDINGQCDYSSNKEDWSPRTAPHPHDDLQRQNVAAPAVFHLAGHVGFLGVDRKTLGRTYIPLTQGFLTIFVATWRFFGWWFYPDLGEPNIMMMMMMMMMIMMELVVAYSFPNKQIQLRRLQLKNEGCCTAKTTEPSSAGLTANMTKDHLDPPSTRKNGVVLPNCCWLVVYLPL